MSLNFNSSLIQIDFVVSHTKHDSWDLFDIMKFLRWACLCTMIIAMQEQINNKYKINIKIKYKYKNYNLL